MTLGGPPLPLDSQAPSRLGSHAGCFQLNTTSGNSETAHQEKWQGAQQGATSHFPDALFLLELNPTLPKRSPSGAFQS